MRARPKLRGTHLDLHPAVCPYRVTRLKIIPFVLNPSLCLLQRGSMGDLLDLNLNPAVSLKSDASKDFPIINFKVQLPSAAER
ncbi:unnamed protein product [Oreochromis niloticus]|nr:unnamed protein product [Mustela putorius furo]